MTTKQLPETLEDVQPNLGEPNFAMFEDDNPSPEITEAVLNSSESAQSVAVGAGDITVVMAKFATSFMAKRNGEHWRLSKEEAEELKHSMDALVPDLSLSPAWTVAAVVVGITAPRILTDFQIQQDMEKEVNASESKENSNS
ncbi:hypothetical protein [Pseudoalteromonas xiamenensis]